MEQKLYTAHHKIQLISVSKFASFKHSCASYHIFPTDGLRQTIDHTKNKKPSYQNRIMWTADSFDIFVKHCETRSVNI